MGVPVSPRNIFPSNIQGLPTWFEVRVSEAGHLGRRGGVDIMVAMNPATFREDVDSVLPGGYLLYDSTKPLDRRRYRSDINWIGIPLTEICLAEYEDPRQRQLFKNIVYVGALSALLDMEFETVTGLVADQFRGKDRLIAPNVHALELGNAWVRENLECPIGIRVRRSDAAGSRILVNGNSAAALGCVYAGATVAAWYPITPSTSLVDAFSSHCERLRVDAETGSAELRRRPGRGRAGRDRHGDRRVLERRARLHRDERPRNFAHDGVPGARLLRRDPGGAVQHPAGQPLDRHADPHPAGGHSSPARTHRTATPSTCCSSRRTRARRSSSRPPRSTSPSGCRPRSS